MSTISARKESHRDTIGIVLINGLGDCLLAVPAIRAIRLRSQSLIIVVPPDTAYDDVLLDLRENAVHVQARLTPEHACWEIDEQELFAKLRNCSEVVFMIDWDSDSLRELRQRLEGLGVGTHIHPFEWYQSSTGREIHQIDRNMRLARPLLRANEQPVRLPEEQLNPRHARSISVHPEPSCMEKTYSTDEWVALIDAIGHACSGAEIFVHGLQYAEKIAAQCTARVVPAVGTVQQSLRIAGNSALIVAVDSYLLHYTDLVNVPAVALFRSTSPLRWGPYFTKNSIVHVLESIADQTIRSGLVRDVRRLMETAQP